jgi:hypothetical protein
MVSAVTTALSENFQIPVGCSFMTWILYLNDDAACVVMDEGNMSATYVTVRWYCGQRGDVLDDFELLFHGTKCFECMRI